jgi:hypothetical protein
MKKLKIECPECKHEFSSDLKHQLEHMMTKERAALLAGFSEAEKILNQEVDYNKMSRTKEIKTIIL